MLQSGPINDDGDDEVAKRNGYKTFIKSTALTLQRPFISVKS